MSNSDDFRPLGSSGGIKDTPIPTKRLPGERLPKDYGKTKIVLLVIDPYWLHTYWHMPNSKIEELKSSIGVENFESSRFVVRVYDITDVDFNGENAHSYFDQNVSREARNWYINIGTPDRNYIVDLGLITQSGQFILIARSNVVRSPSASISSVVDEAWLSVDEDYAETYLLSGGEQIGQSSFEIKELIAKRFQEELSSHIFSSFSSGQPLEKNNNEEKSDFWLKVDTELILYGATEPDAELTVMGKKVKLRPDGTFTMRFALQDGEIKLPVEAHSKDKKHQRKITPIVNRTTR
jgi:hypothetical protein